MSLFERRTLFEAADALGIEPPVRDSRFTGVSTDTRSLEPGSLFVALTGPNFNGHDYLSVAYEKDAAGAIVSQPVECDLPLLHVKDTLDALGKLAANVRSGFRGPVFGITGSNGKTTTKEMLAAILRNTGVVLATRGNFNNDIGMPLTLMELEPSDEFAVIEMGANHAGEIAYLASIAQPDIAIVTNAGAAHLEGFGSIEGVAKAKGELFSSLGKKGTAIINRCDDYYDLWCELAGDCRILSFGVEQPDADFNATDIQSSEYGSVFNLSTPDTDVIVQIVAFGRHNVLNAVAASAAAWAAGLSEDEIRTGLEKFRTVQGRLRMLQSKEGARVIDDAYNANPDSVHAAIDVLSHFQGRRVLVLGDMLEAGDDERALHQEIGEYASASGIDDLMVVGDLAAEAVKGFGENAQEYESKRALIKALKQLLNEQTTILIKGSRGAGLDEVVRALVNEEYKTDQRLEA